MGFLYLYTLSTKLTLHFYELIKAFMVNSSVAFRIGGETERNVDSRCYWKEVKIERLMMASFTKSTTVLCAKITSTLICYSTKYVVKVYTKGSENTV